MAKRAHPAGIRTLLIALSMIASPASSADGVVVIGDERFRGFIDGEKLGRIYLGLDVEVNGIRVTPINAPSGPVRDRFLETIHKANPQRDDLKSDDDYRAKWIARRYRGLGAPPREIPNAAEIVKYVSSTPGAIAYVDAADVPPGVTILLK